MASLARDQHPCPHPLPPSTVFSFTLALFALSACADRVTAPSGGKDRPLSSRLRNDRGATRAPVVGTLSWTPLGPPPLSDQARPRLSPPDDPVVPIPRGDAPIRDETRSATSTSMLVHHGGVVQTAPRIYLVYWGATWFSGGDPDGVGNRLNTFYKGLGGSSYANVLKQYDGEGTSFTNPTGQYRGWRQDTAPIPTHPTQSQLIAVVRRAAKQVNDFGYNAQYVIALRWGVSDQRSDDHGWCARHSWTTAGPEGNWVTFTVMPYMPYLDKIGRGCGGGTVNGAKGKLDGVTILAAHEYGETVNDPDFQSWWDADTDEVADKCSWINLANYTLRNGYSFPVQPQWSNRWRQTKGNGCLYS
jgi:hypothetical protein